ncbi:MAG: hypothetical protein HKN16_01780 [Saprospiraceae bacterium]|nr:hypothetical protein [Saprospiraceae bacterium]
MNPSEIAGKQPEEIPPKDEKAVDTWGDQFPGTYQQVLESLQDSKEFGDYLTGLVSGSRTIIQEGLPQADYAFETLEKIRPSKESWNLAAEAYFNTFQWPKILKSLAISWRDTLLEAIKASVMAGDKKVDATILEKLKADGITFLNQKWERAAAAKEDFKSNMRNKSGQLMDEWIHNENPWPVYREQLETLLQQVDQLEVQHSKLVEASKTFENIKTLMDETLILCQEHIHKLQRHSEDAANFIEANLQEKPAVLKNKLEDLQQLVHFSYRLDFLTAQVDNYLDSLPDQIDVATHVQGGEMIVKEIPFERASRQWVESEILPKMYEFWGVLDQASNGQQVAVLNISNRLTLLEQEQVEDPSQSDEKMALCKPLRSFLEGHDTRIANLASLNQSIQRKMEDTFLVSTVYREDQFFFPNLANFSQIRIGQNQFWDRISNWWSEGLNKITQLWQKVEREEALSHAERIARVITQREGRAGNQQYNNIFLTQGYLGESFVVGRQKEFDHMAKLIGQWENGYRGSAIVQGPRFSGKTLLLEMVANKYFPRKTIRLNPESSLLVEGRRMETSHDLSKALEFIKKYTLNQRPLVLLDDLELWEDPNTPLGTNLRALEKFISEFSGRMFFMASTSKVCASHFQKTHGLLKAFQAVLDVSKMSDSEMRQAILIRHGATHKQLVDESGDKLSGGAMKKAIDTSLKMAAGNIGEAFFKWTMHIQDRGNEKVQFVHEPQFYLPDFIHPDLGIMLATILRKKYTNDYRIRKLFGPSFKEKYASILLRMVRTKILIRKSSGELCINDFIAVDLARMLKAKGYLIES